MFRKIFVALLLLSCLAPSVDARCGSSSSASTRVSVRVSSGSGFKLFGFLDRFRARRDARLSARLAPMAATQAIAATAWELSDSATFAASSVTYGAPIFYSAPASSNCPGGRCPVPR